MTPANSYRKAAAELRAKALKAPSDRTARDLGNLARCYLRLATQAEHNSRTDIAVEIGAKPRLEGGGNLSWPQIYFCGSSRSMDRRLP